MENRGQRGGDCISLCIASRYLRTPKNESFPIMSVHAVALASFSRTEVFKHPCSEKVRQGGSLNGGSVCSLTGGWFKNQLLFVSGHSKLFLNAGGVNLRNTVPVLEVGEEKADILYTSNMSNCQWAFLIMAVLCFPCVSVVVFLYHFSTIAFFFFWRLLEGTVMWLSFFL